MIKSKEYYHAKKGENITSESLIYNIGIEKEKEKKYTLLVDIYGPWVYYISVKREAK